MATPKKHESFAAAIAAAQSNMSNVIKNAKNEAFRKGGKPSGYADLAAVRDVALPAFNAEGIAVLQAVDGGDGWITVSTSLLWGAERVEVGRCSLPLGEPKNLKHECGSISSYLRRYQLASCAQISQVDEDGNGQGYVSPPKASPPQAPRATKAQMVADQQRGKAREILKGPIGCTTPQDGHLVISWVTGGAVGLREFNDDATAAGDVLAALQAKNDGGTLYEYMHSEAVEAARLEAVR